MENHHFNRYCNNLPEGRGYNGIFCGIFSWNKHSHGVFMGDDIRAISWESLDFCCRKHTSKCTAVFRKTIPPQTGIQVPKVFDCGTYEKPRIHSIVSHEERKLSEIMSHEEVAGAITILNNMSLSMGRITSHILKIREKKTWLKPPTSFPFSSGKMGLRDSPHSEVPSH
jgi:hypothetical protein